MYGRGEVRHSYRMPGDILPALRAGASDFGLPHNRKSVADSLQVSMCAYAMCMCVCMYVCEQ